MDMLTARNEKKSRMKAYLETVSAEIRDIKIRRGMVGPKGWRYYPKKYQTRRLSQLVGIRSSLQANIARF